MGTEHRHALAVGVERDLVESPVVWQFPGCPPPHAGQRHFHRVAQQSALAALVDLPQAVT
jgi:hypothetical protein